MNKEELKEQRKLKVNKIDKHIGARLRDRRKAVGLSQRDLGNKLGGLTFQQVQKYEKGTNRIASSTLYELCDILLVPITYFYEGIENVVKTNKNNNPKTDSENLEKLSKKFLKIENQNIREESVSIMKVLCDMDRKIANDDEGCKKED